MLNEEDLANQQELLAAHRRTLAVYLRQQAQLGVLAPPSVVNGIAETRAQIGRLAAAAGVKSVVLTHLVPGADRETGTSQYANGVKERFKGPVIVANDLDRF